MRQTCETQGRRLCTKAIQLGNVGYDYAGTKQLLSKTKLTRIVKVPCLEPPLGPPSSDWSDSAHSRVSPPTQGVGFLLGLVIVGREVRRGSQQLASTLLACVNETIPFSAV